MRRRGDHDALGARARNSLSKRPRARTRRRPRGGRARTPPSETSCASVNQCAASPDEAHEPAPWPRSRKIVSPALPAARDAGDVAHEPDAADDRRRRDRRVRPSRCRARRCRRRQGSRAPRRRREMPSIACSSSQPISGLLRVAEVEAVGERERLAARAGDVERGLHDRAPARPRTGCASRAAARRARPRCRACRRSAARRRRGRAGVRCASRRAGRSARTPRSSARR